jgi:hypothetical protein
MTSKTIDPWAAGATVLAVGMTGAYFGIISGQGGDLAVWFVTAMAIAIACGAYGTARTLPMRRYALLVCGVLLSGLGLLAILSIGLPILVAGVLAFIGFARSFASRSPYQDSGADLGA